MAPLPTPRLLVLAMGAVVPLILATVFAEALYLGVAYVVMVAAIVALDLRRTPSAKAFRVGRRHEERLSLGAANPVDVQVEWFGQRVMESKRSIRLWIRDETPPGIPVDKLVLDGAILPGAEWTGRYHLIPRRRGDYAFGSITIRVETPFRLLVLQYSYLAAGPVRVYPNLLAVRRYELLARHGRLNEIGLRQTRLIGRGTEYERLRDYVTDDDYRRIAWKATARRHQPVTVEFETERSQNLILLLDTGRLMGTPVGDMEKLDHAVNAVLMLSYVALQRDDRVGLIAFADRVDVYVPPSRGRRQFHLLLESLYKIRAQPIESNPGRALSFAAARQAKRSLMVLLTDFAEAADAEDLVAHLGYLARRHLPLCVTLSDPDILDLSTRRTTDSRRAYERVVAQRLLDERRSILDTLEQQGAYVLDVSAEQLTAEVINRYLEIKAKTLL